MTAPAEGGRVVHLALAGVHSHLRSSLCASCPEGPTGCCAGPPAVAWADIGRIVSLGGTAWLLAQIAAGDMRPVARGLAMRRVENRESNATVWAMKCVYHGPGGCTIAPEQRSATCNYYLCDAAFADAGEGDGQHPDVARARRGHEAITMLYGRWDLELSSRVDARYPEGLPASWDAAFLGWLCEEWQSLVAASRRDLRRLGR
jgi:hypothetical protein